MVQLQLSIPTQSPLSFNSQSDYEFPLNLSNRDLALKPPVADSRNIPIPYIIKNCMIINEGTHNGDYYPASELENNIKQFEGLSLFKDHHQNQMGGTVADWCGEIHNPKWNPRLRAIMGDCWVADEALAKHLHFGAKFGLSVTVDADIRHSVHEGRKYAIDPVFRSCSFVLDPAVRQTMLNERKQQLEEKIMEIDNGRSTPPVDEVILKKLEAIENRLGSVEQMAKEKPEEEKYPYPKDKKMKDMSDAELEAELARRKKPLFPEEKEKLESEKISELEAKLKTYEAKEMESKVGAVIDKEVKIGLLDSKDSEEAKARVEELKKLSTDALSAVEANLDRTLKKMESLPADSEPAAAAESQPAKMGANTQRREYSRIELDVIREQANQKLFNMMLAAQGRAV